jgi:hypothetical protein
VGARVIEKRDGRTGKETRALVVVCAAVVGPLALTYFLIAADMRSDLSELRPRQGAAAAEFTLVGWKDLEADPPHTPQLPAGQARLLGYMMDGYKPVRGGTPVKMFVLMPEAGQLLHPAHRIPDEMVEVWLGGDAPVPYKDRELVWATGQLRRVRLKAEEGTALYALTAAAVEPAAQRDITRWFAP